MDLTETNHKQMACLGRRHVLEKEQVFLFALSFPVLFYLCFTSFAQNFDRSSHPIYEFITKKLRLKIMKSLFLYEQNFVVCLRGDVENPFHSSFRFSARMFQMQLLMDIKNNVCLGSKGLFLCCFIFFPLCPKKARKLIHLPFRMLHAPVGYIT